MTLHNLRKLSVAVLIFFTITVVLLSSSTALSSPHQQNPPIDVTISLHSSPTTDAERAPYESIIEYFADGAFETSNGMHRIGRVNIYTGSDFADKADIVWIEKCIRDTDTSSPHTDLSGRAVEGWNINMCDVIDIPLAFDVNYLESDERQQDGGYTLAHEWGHYFYGLYDEYRGDPSYDVHFHMPHSTDEPVPNSIMNDQWNARGGNYEWLNFSTVMSYEKSGGGTRETAQYRVYGASGWETLARPTSNDPRNGPRQSLPERIHYPELASVAPGDNEDSTIDLPDSPRSDLNIVWISEDVTSQVVIDHSGSMSSENKMENAKTAAKLLVDLAAIDSTTIGIIKFNDDVTVVQPLTEIDSQVTKDAIKAQIDTIQPDGFTAIGDAAQKALDDLLAFGAEDTNRIVYLLTNGQSNTGTDPLSVIPAYQAAQVSLYTFGYGSDVNQDTLQKMADDTGGEYHFSPTSLAEVTQVFQDVQQLTSSTIGVTTGSTQVGTSTPSSFPIHVDPTLSRLDIAVTYQGSPSAVDLTLLDPNGNPSGAANCSPSGTETLCLFSMDSPIEGSWTLQAIASSQDIDLTYRASGSGENVITFAASVTSLTGDMIQYPEPIVLLATLGKEVPISGAVVNATIQAPDGTVAAFLVLDNGVAPDAKANDGLYSAILDYSQNGTYNITVQFDNSAGTAQLTPISIQPSIGPDGEAVPLPDPVPITENFQRFERTQVNVDGVQNDDHGNTPQDATSLPPDNTDIPGKIDYQNDVDVFRVDILSDIVNWAIRVSNFALGMDPRLRVFASDMTTVLADVDLTTNASENGYLFLPLSVNAGDTLYMEVSHHSGGVGGVYGISAGPQISSDSGLPVVTMSKIVTQSTVVPNGTVEYTITLENTGTGDTVGVSVVDTLPAGFSYIPGSTSGATTDDPSINGQRLMWSGPFTIPVGETLTLNFKSTAATSFGTYFNNVEAGGSNMPLTQTGDTAPVVVQALQMCSITGKVSLQGRNHHNGTTILVDSMPVTTTVRNGGFNVANLAPNVYKVTASYSHYLSSEDNAVKCLTGETTMMPQTTLLGGDANSDKQINILDMVVIGAAYNSCIGDPGFDPHADINETGCVDIFDMVLASSNYGRRSPTSWPTIMSSSPTATNAGANINYKADLDRQSLRKLSDTKLWDIQVNNVSAMYGIDVDITFDPTRVKIVDVDPGRAGAQVLPGPLFTDRQYFMAKNEVTVEEKAGIGTIHFAATLLNPAKSIDADGVVATIPFKPIEEDAEDVLKPPVLFRIEDALLANKAGGRSPVGWGDHTIYQVK